MSYIGTSPAVADAVSKTNGGTFDGEVNFDAGANGEIGGTTPAAGTFTALEATSLDNTPIGGTTPAAGAFTTLDATGNATIDGTGVAKQGLPIVTESTTARTLALADTGSYIRTTNSSATTVTVPTNASVAFPVGAEVVVFQAGTGAVTFAGASGVTVNSKDSALQISAQYAAATLKKVATDEWDLIGDLA